MLEMVVKLSFMSQFYIETEYKYDFGKIDKLGSEILSNSIIFGLSNSTIFGFF